MLREDPEVYAAADRWIEAADWIVWQLTGAESRNLCTAGYKGIHQDGRLPRARLPRLAAPGLRRLHRQTRAPAVPAGHPGRGAQPRGCRTDRTAEGTAVGVGNVDAHVTTAAAQALEPGHMLAIMGTSTCHIMNSDVLAEVPGMCGVVRDGVVPGLWGYEAGQSGVGDIFAWAVRTALPDAVRGRGPRRGICAYTNCSPRRPPPSRSARTGCWRWTGTAATARCWWTTTCPGCSSA